MPPDIIPPIPRRSVFMSLPRTPLRYSPFSKLNRKFEPRPERRTGNGMDPIVPDGQAGGQEDDGAIFLEAMSGVEPLPEDRKITGSNRAPAGMPHNEPDDEHDAAQVRKLINLVLKGEGFSVSDTPEYMEGTGYNVHPGMAQRLHQGDFSIQASLDLHGLNSSEARDEFESFLRKSIYSGKRAVLVIHGRGLSSPGEPVLKARVRQWLTRSHWRKWVIAFTSAASHDGGAGATYVLLRERPVPKSLRKRKPA
jgi:DNA-nicking Smr family endonuclease